MPRYQVSVYRTIGPLVYIFFIAASFLEDNVGYYTETLHKSLKGFRSNDRVVINIIISRMKVQ